MQLGTSFGSGTDSIAKFKKPHQRCGDEDNRYYYHQSDDNLPFHSRWPSLPKKIYPSSFSHRISTASPRPAEESDPILFSYLNVTKRQAKQASAFTIRWKHLAFSNATVSQKFFSRNGSLRIGGSSWRRIPVGWQKSERPSQRLLTSHDIIELDYQTIPSDVAPLKHS